MNNNTVSRKVVPMIATILSAIMLAVSSIPSLVPATAFAQQDETVDNLPGLSNIEPNNEAENIVEDKSVVVDPTIQVSTETATNVNNDNDVAFSEGCADISDDDEVTQTNRQAADQEVHKNNDVGDGGIVVEPTIQVSTQIATNVNTDNDVYIVLGCDDGDAKISDDDKVTQQNEQIANQESISDSEVGDGGVLVSPDIQRSTQIATNHNEDNDRVVYVGLPDL